MFSLLKATFRVFRGLLFSTTKAWGKMFFYNYIQSCIGGERNCSPLGVGVEVKPDNPEQCVSVWPHWQVKGSSISVLFIPEILACWLAPH